MSLFLLFNLQQICKKGEDSGIKLLTTLSSLFVSNSKQDISIEFSYLDPGWQIVGDKVNVSESTGNKCVLR